MFFCHDSLLKSLLCIANFWRNSHDYHDPLMNFVFFNHNPLTKFVFFDENLHFLTEIWMTFRWSFCDILTKFIFLLQFFDKIYFLLQSINEFDFFFTCSVIEIRNNLSEPIIKIRNNFSWPIGKIRISFAQPIDEICNVFSRPINKIHYAFSHFFAENSNVFLPIICQNS